jgi:hypothetical protein
MLTRNSILGTLLLALVCQEGVLLPATSQTKIADRSVQSRRKFNTPPCEILINHTFEYKSLKIRISRVIFSPTNQLQAQYDSMQVLVYAEINNLNNKTIYFIPSQFLLACDGGQTFKQWLKPERLILRPHEKIRIAMPFNPPTKRFYNHPKLVSSDGKVSIDLTDTIYDAR